MKKRNIFAVLSAAAAAGVVFFFVRGRYDVDRDLIRVSGNIEATTVPVSFNIPGRVERRVVCEGESVTNGQVVAFLDRAELEQEAVMRRADLQSAQAALDELEAGTRAEEIEQAAAALEVAMAEALRARSEFERQKELFQRKAISPHEFETADALCGMASARVREGEARLALLKNGPREETIRAARARLELAEHAVALAEILLGYTTLTAPLAGIVLTEGVESGEYVNPGTPVVTVGDIVNVWLRAYIAETDMGRVKIGQAARVFTDTYPGKAYEGRLSFIASQAEFTPKEIQTARERVKLVYRIKVDIVNPRQELKPGMPADAELDPQ